MPRPHRRWSPRLRDRRAQPRADCRPLALATGLGALTMVRHTLPGQLDMPQTEERLADLARLKAAAPMRPTKPQMPCDVGLFSDEADQIDLIEMLMDPYE